jgi:acyl-CoA synthetase (NDP forming)
MAPKGIDVIVGAHRDSTFGPVVAFGLGGIFEKLLQDVALALAPVDHATALRMIASVKGYPLLAGARGLGPVDLNAIAGVIVAVSKFAADNADTVARVEVNPLRAFRSGVLALDAVILPRASTHGRSMQGG